MTATPADTFPAPAARTYDSHGKYLHVAQHANSLLAAATLGLGSGVAECYIMITDRLAILVAGKPTSTARQFGSCHCSQSLPCCLLPCADCRSEDAALLPRLSDGGCPAS